MLLVLVTTFVNLIMADVCVSPMLLVGLVTNVKKDIGDSLVVGNVNVVTWLIHVTTSVDIVLAAEISLLVLIVIGNSFFHLYFIYSYMLKECRLPIVFIFLFTFNEV